MALLRFDACVGTPLLQGGPVVGKTTNVLNSAEPVWPKGEHLCFDPLECKNNDICFDIRDDFAPPLYATATHTPLLPVRCGCCPEVMRQLVTSACGFGLALI
jgi:hypothetical protein